MDSGYESDSRGGNRSDPKSHKGRNNIELSDLPFYDPDRKKLSLEQIKEYIVDILKEEYERGYRDGKAEREVIEDDLK